ncbi:MAG: lipid II:glycine glycyltransferase FemX [Acidimicrobiales bacterium]
MRSAAGPPSPTMGGPARLCDPCRDDVWAELVERSGTLFHSPAWLRVLRDAYRLRPRAVVSSEGATDGGGGGVAWVEVADVRGRRVVSLPFSDFAGPIGAWSTGSLAPLKGERAATTPSLVTRLRLATPGGPRRGAIDANDLRRYRIELGLAETGRLAWHWTELPPLGRSTTGATSTSDDDRLWPQLASGARQNIRRSRRAGVVVDVRSDLDALEDYHRLHLELRKAKYRLLAQPRSFFIALHRHFGPDRLRIVLARLDGIAGSGGGEAIAGVILLRHGDTAYYKLNASNPAGLSVRANDAVMWEAMAAARRWGCRWFDFGVSDLDQPGLIRYKDKYSTGRGEVVLLGRAGSGRPWSARQIDRILPLTSRALTAPRCPDALGRQASRVLYRLYC